MTVGTDAGIKANKHILLHLAAVAQADAGPPVDVVARIGAAESLLVCEVGLGREGIDPPSHEIRRHRVIHEQVRHSDTVTILSDVHVNLVTQNLNAENE